MPNLTTCQDCWRATLIQGQRGPSAAPSLLPVCQKVLCQDPRAGIDQRTRKPEQVGGSIFCRDTLAVAVFWREGGAGLVWG